MDKECKEKLKLEEKALNLEEIETDKAKAKLYDTVAKRQADYIK